MRINTSLVSNNNSYDVNEQLNIVIHNTDNFKRTADAKAHAQAQHDGNLQGISVHLYVDDKSIYQAMPYNRGAWHIGVNYGNKTLFGKVNNRNSIAIEMCVNEGYDYEKALQNTADAALQIMSTFGIPAERVYQHYDICNKNCPSQIRAKGDWGRFKAMISGSKGFPTSKADFINKVSEIAVALYKETKILPSVVIAQCCLETGYGLGADSTLLMQHNNLLGMKADLINNTWNQYSAWDGQTFVKRTPEEVNGKIIYVDAKFRHYPDYETCIRDYTAGFLLHVRNDYGYKYQAVAGLTDPKSVITIISKGGYATDSGYITKVMNIIKKDNLTKYDPAVNDRYVVRRRWAEKKYQIGAYHVLENAKRQADENWGFRVYDLEAPKKAIYKPKLTRAQKMCAAMVRLNQWLLDDIKSGKDWRYYNGKASESTFWKTRKAKKYYTNCAGGIYFCMKEAGLPGTACDWYGQKGGEIRWLNSKAEANLRKYAYLIKIGNKTPKQLMSEGMLCPGDILTFVKINHTCGYLGNGLSFDSGHAYCKEGGEGARFVKWIGALSWADYKVGYIIRLK